MRVLWCLDHSQSGIVRIMPRMPSQWAIESWNSVENSWQARKRWGWRNSWNLRNFIVTRCHNPLHLFYIWGIIISVKFKRVPYINNWSDQFAFNCYPHGSPQLNSIRVEKSISWVDIRTIKKCTKNHKRRPSVLVLPTFDILLAEDPMPFALWLTQLSGKTILERLRAAEELRLKVLKYWVQMSLEFSLRIVVRVALQHLMQRKLFNIEFPEFLICSLNSHCIGLCCSGRAAQRDLASLQLLSLCALHFVSKGNFLQELCSDSRKLFRKSSKEVSLLAPTDRHLPSKRQFASGNIQQPGPSWCELSAQTDTSRCKDTSGPKFW